MKLGMTAQGSRTNGLAKRPRAVGPATDTSASRRVVRRAVTTPAPLPPPARPNGRCRIAVTGGPGGGKTTAADLFRREIGDRVVVVPESATLLFSGGFPRSGEPHARRAAQQAIYHVQTNLEDVQSALYPDRILLCDRGTIDGAAYWPGTPEAYFEAVGSTHERELARYDTVLFFESAAVGGLSVEGGNPTRVESIAEAAALDGVLRALWAKHHSFVVIPHCASFVQKVLLGLAALQAVVVKHA